ncbi:TPA: four-carbon acid sugar kinase family protein [Vibrio parahaemolyticus]|nr:four-carbon acid sugar kinase family protein [Vibrio parahaemolyticus]HCG7048773.1 four-carbon acid sugar kinase family protein [Vibrio parahaemolyticus]HCG7254429.1 four-carbon acid sugar kinase family protein [Vibrio parahaemolyticus]HCZ9547562.1 four-carbon acid sugar kinase family protein [Vibrio alginolyticus]
MRIGVIADDFTGGTDIASFLVKGGLNTVQLSGVPQIPIETDADAIVISLKSRSCAPSEAIEQSLNALTYLQQNDCTQIYFKYCSTFDSTEIGNIGPVTDALMAALKTKFTVVCPSLPLNGRCVFNGNLYVNGVLLNESGMRDHPITPMCDSNLVRLMDVQASGTTALINYQTVEQGCDAILTAYAVAQQEGYKYAVVDAFNEQQLSLIAQSLVDMPLITGGSGLAYHIAALASQHKKQDSMMKVPNKVPSVVLSGSCSQMTNLQVGAYQDKAPAYAIEAERCLTDDRYAQQVSEWVMGQQGLEYAPMVYATANVEKMKQIQQQYGAEKASAAVEDFFAQLTEILSERGIRNFIVAGGETSGVVTQHLSLDALNIGKEIAPGVPWVFSLDGHFALALKSGNFGSEQFFSQAQEMLHA